MNKPLTQTDLAELESIMRQSGIGEKDHWDRAEKESQGLGHFVRSLVGLDREAAKDPLGSFFRDSLFTANHIEFVNGIVNHLTENGVREASQLYESPFTDLVPQGPESLFTPTQLDRLLTALDKINASTRAA